MKKYILLTAMSIGNSKVLKYHEFSVKQFFLLFVTNVVVIMIQYLKKKNLFAY